MVKGITKQAVLVRSPDPELFEQAIFIVRGERGDVTPEDILRQAREAAGAAGSPCGWAGCCSAPRSSARCGC